MEALNKFIRLFLALLFVLLGLFTILSFCGINILPEKVQVFSLTDSLLATGIIVLIELALGVLLFMNKVSVSTTLARIVVGSVFVFSGFIKANDPVGFGYKLTEYFEVFADDVSTTKITDPTTKEVSIKIDHNPALRKMFLGMHDYSLALAMFMCTLEMALGVLLLLGMYRNFTLWMLFLLVLFFGFLTFYSAYYEKVQSCGCFGDFIPLKPWQSFGKDLILTFMVLLLFYGREIINPLLSNMRVMQVTTLILLIPTILFSIYTYNFLPIFDFRPYKIGTDLNKSLHAEMVSFFKLKNKKTGEIKEFSPMPSGWDQEYDYIPPARVELKDKNIKPIDGFAIQDSTGSDYADDFLQLKGPQFFLVAYDLKKTNKEAFGKIKDFAQLCAKDSISFIGLTHSQQAEVNKFFTGEKIPFKFYFADDTPLKTMIRSNPGLMLVKDGVVTAIWHYHSFPSYNDVKEKYFKK